MKMKMKMKKTNIILAHNRLDIRHDLLLDCPIQHEEEDCEGQGVSGHGTVD